MDNDELEEHDQLVQTLDWQSREAMAAALVAEQMGGIIAVMSAVILYLAAGAWLEERLGWLRWLIVVGVIPAVYTLAVRDYHKRYEAAWDAYEKVTRTGRYRGRP